MILECNMCLMEFHLFQGVPLGPIGFEWSTLVTNQYLLSPSRTWSYARKDTRRKASTRAEENVKSKLKDEINIVR